MQVAVRQTKIARLEIGNQSCSSPTTFSSSWSCSNVTGILSFESDSTVSLTRIQVSQGSDSYFFDCRPPKKLLHRPMEGIVQKLPYINQPPSLRPSTTATMKFPLPQANHGNGTAVSCHGSSFLFRCRDCVREIVVRVVIRKDGQK